MSIPKQFERQVLHSFREGLPGCWAHKNPDVHGKGFHVESPPDIIVVHNKVNLLVEAKAVKGTSIPFSRLADHQREHLLAFDDTRHDSFGVVAVLAYNGLLGHARRYDCYLIPITEWTSLENALGRKSIPLAREVAAYLYPWRCEWIPGEGVFDLRHALHNITGKRF